MGHPSRHALKSIPGIFMNEEDNNICDACHHAKETRSAFPISYNNAANCFELVHYDIWGPYRMASLMGAHYFLTIVDDHSKATWIYLMEEK